MTQRTLSAVAVLASLSLIGCFDDGEGIVIPEEQARVEGRVETAAAVSAQSAAQATTVAVVAVESDGSVTSLAEADVEADGTFRVTEVPVGRAGLQVVARSETAAEVGRVLVHGETEDEVTITVAPITPEATVEARVAARLRASGEAEAAANSGGIDLLVRLDDAEAGALLAADAELQAYAEGFAAAEAWLEASLAAHAPSFTRQTRLELLIEAALTHADSRDAGTPPATAHETFVEATLDGFVGAGLGLEALALATAARVSGAAEGSANGSASTRLELARRTVDVNLRARGRLAADADAEAPAGGGSAVAGILASARAEVAAASTLAEIDAALVDARDACEDALLAAIVDASGGLDLLLEAQVEAAIALLFGEADLRASLAAAGSASEGAEATSDFQGNVEAGVTTLVQLLDGVLALDAEAFGALVVASRADGAIQ